MLRGSIHPVFQPAGHGCTRGACWPLPDCSPQRPVTNWSLSSSLLGDGSSAPQPNPMRALHPLHQAGASRDLSLSLEGPHPILTPG